MKVRIEWHYQQPKNKKSTLLHSDYLDPNEALRLAEDMQKTGRVKQLEFFDDTEKTLLKKEIVKYIQGVEQEPHSITAYFDGGFNLDTKQAGLGIVIYYEHKGERFRIRKNDRFESIDSNNEAEYAALWLLLLQLEELGVHHLNVTIKGDSQVVVNQLNLEWACYEDNLNQWIKRIEDKTKQLGLRPTYEFISRKENQEADQLASQALSAIPVSSHLNLSNHHQS